jgi:hypothetical protein
MQRLGPLYIEELDRDFTKREVKEWTLRMKNNKASGWDGIPIEFWKDLCNGEQGVGILTNMFNKIKSRKQFPLEWKTAIFHQEIIEEFHFYRYVVKYFREFWQGN